MLAKSPRGAWGPLEGSEQSVALTVLLHGPIARIDLAKRLGLSSGSLTRLTKGLLASGLLVEGAAQLIPMGRPTLPLDVVPDSAHFVGVKVTDSDIFLVVTDLRIQELAQVSQPIQSSDPYAVAQQIARLIAQLGAKFGAPSVVGVTFGAIISEHKVIVRDQFLGWNEVAFADMLQQLVGVTVILDNDVRALTQLEDWFGIARGLQDFVLLTVGAGVGVGVVLDGRLLGTSPGGVSHLIIDPQLDAQCSQGHRGCADAVLQKASLLKRSRDHIGNQALTYDEMLERYNECTPVLEHAAHCLGVLAGHVAQFYATANVLLSGEGVGFAALFSDALNRGARSSTPVDHEVPVITTQPFEFDEWARGGAAAAVKHYVLGRAAN